jgi:hypothetical protein
VTLAALQGVQSYPQKACQGLGPGTKQPTRLPGSPGPPLAAVIAQFSNGLDQYPRAGDPPPVQRGGVPPKTQPRSNETLDSSRAQWVVYICAILAAME